MNKRPHQQLVPGRWTHPDSSPTDWYMRIQGYGVLERNGRAAGDEYPSGTPPAANCSLHKREGSKIEDSAPHKISPPTHHRASCLPARLPLSPPMAGGAMGAGWAAAPSLVIQAGMVISLPRPRPAMFAGWWALLAAKKSFFCARHASSSPLLWFASCVGDQCLASSLFPLADTASQGVLGLCVAPSVPTRLIDWGSQTGLLRYLHNCSNPRSVRCSPTDGTHKNDEIRTHRAHTTAAGTTVDRWLPRKLLRTWADACTRFLGF